MNITYILPIIAVIFLLIKKIRKIELNDAFDYSNSSLSRLIATFCIMYGHTIAAISGGYTTK